VLQQATPPRVGRGWPRPAQLLATLMTAAVAVTFAGAGCKADAPPSAATTTPAAAPSSAQPTASREGASLCEQIIDIDTSAGYMQNKTFVATTPTAEQLQKIVNLVLLRESDLVAAAGVAGLSDPLHVVLGFYHALATAAQTNPAFYGDYVAGKPSAVNQIAAAVGDLTAFRAKQQILAAYEKDTCGITFPAAHA
jgi:hypothetical protein